MVERGGGRGQGGLGTGVSHTVQRPQGQCLVWEVGRPTWEEEVGSPKLANYKMVFGLCPKPTELAGPVQTHQQAQMACTVAQGLAPPTNQAGLYSCAQFGSKFELSYWVCTVGPALFGSAFLGGSTFGATQLVRPQWKGPGVRGRRPQLGLDRWAGQLC